MKLTLYNVGVLGPGTTTINFSTGVNAITGENGHGKSTIVNALYFALTGETIDGSLNEDMITWGCSQMSITLEYSDVVIKRSLNTKGTSKASFVKGNSEPIVRKKEILDAICELFGILDPSVFKMVYIAEQYKSIDIIQATDAFRVDMLSTIFAFSRLESIRNILLDAANSIDIYEIPEEMFKLAKTTLDEAKEHLNKWRKEQQRLTALLLTPERRKELEDIINAPDKGSTDFLTAELLKTESLIAELQEESESLPKPPSTEEAELYKKAMSNQAFDQRREALKKRLEALGDPPAISSVSLQSYITEIDNQLIAVNADRKVTSERSMLLKEGKCPITQGPPCPDLQALTNQETITADITEIDARIAKLNSDRLEITGMLSAAQEYESSYKSLNHELSNIQDNYDVGDFDLDSYESRVKAAQDVAVKQAEISKKIGEASCYVTELKQKLKDISGLVEKTPEEKSLATAAFNFGIEAAAQLNTVNQSFSDAEKRVADSSQTLNLYEIQNKTAEANKDKKYVLEKVRFALHRDNIPRVLIEKLLERLNKVMESYLIKFNFPYTVKFASGGKFIYFTSDGECHETKKLSGGQQYVVVIAFRCALADILNTKFPLFVFDEPTTGLDIQNRDALSEVLLTLGEIKNKVVIIPTHDEKLLPESKIFSV